MAGTVGCSNCLGAELEAEIELEFMFKVFVLTRADDDDAEEGDVTLVA